VWKNLPTARMPTHAKERDKVLGLKDQGRGSGSDPTVLIFNNTEQIIYESEFDLTVQIFNNSQVIYGTSSDPKVPISNDSNKIIIYYKKKTVIKDAYFILMSK
jgi:hypothetical protein